VVNAFSAASRAVCAPRGGREIWHRACFHLGTANWSGVGSTGRRRVHREGTQGCSAFNGAQARFTHSGANKKDKRKKDKRKKSRDSRKKELLDPKRKKAREHVTVHQTVFPTGGGASPQVPYPFDISPAAAVNNDVVKENVPVNESDGDDMDVPNRKIEEVVYSGNTIEELMAQMPLDEGMDINSVPEDLLRGLMKNSNMEKLHEDAAAAKEKNEKAGLTGNGLKIRETGRWVWTYPEYRVPLPTIPVTTNTEEAFSSGLYLGTGRRTNHINPLNSSCPEICILGRSNVGKSSFINALLGSKARSGPNLAKVAKRPGKTVAMHLFGIGKNEGARQRKSLRNYRAVLVDLPGYGFADLGSNARVALSNVIYNYLTERDRNVFVKAFILIDGKVGITRHDQSMIGMLERIGVGYQIVMTKCDLVDDDGLEASVKSVFDFLVANHGSFASPMIYGTSARPNNDTKYFMKTIYGNNERGGIVRVRSEILSLCDAHFACQRESIRGSYGPFDKFK